MSPISQPEIAREYPFVLSVGARKPMFQHSRTFRIPWIRQFAPDPVCDMNPADAKRAGIAEGEEVELMTPGEKRFGEGASGRHDSRRRRASLP